MIQQVLQVHPLLQFLIPDATGPEGCDHDCLEVCCRCLTCLVPSLLFEVSEGGAQPMQLVLQFHMPEGSHSFGEVVAFSLMSRAVLLLGFLVLLNFHESHLLRVSITASDPVEIFHGVVVGNLPLEVALIECFPNCGAIWVHSVWLGARCGSLCSDW